MVSFTTRGIGQPLDEDPCFLAAMYGVALVHQMIAFHGSIPRSSMRYKRNDVGSYEYSRVMHVKNPFDMGPRNGHEKHSI